MGLKSNSEKTLSPSELSAFCTQIAMILKSGISVEEGLTIMREDMKNEEGKQILTSILDKVEIGAPLYTALEASGKFPRYVLDMVEIGEESGKLDEVMESLSDYYEREEGIRKSVRSAITYPLIMVGMMVVVIAVLVTKVLPIFNQVFQQLGSEMSGFSQGLMNFGQAVGSYSLVLIVLVVLLLAAFFVLRSSSAGRERLSRFQAKFFLTRGLASEIASGRFAFAMALMLSSGLDTDRALDMVERLVDNVVIREKIVKCRETVQEGGSFSDALAHSGIFTGIYARMVSVGFKTGAADSVMNKLADRYESEIDEKIGNVISILEPTLVAVLSVVVGMILLSVMLPLMGVMSSIG